jgi:hypothetical protein
MRPAIRSQRSQPVQVRFSPDQVDDIDEFRRELEDIPTRPGAIRELVTRALKALKRSEGKVA